MAKRKEQRLREILQLSKTIQKTNTHLQSPNVFLFFPFLTYVYIYNRSGFIYMYIILFYLRILTVTHIIIVFG